MALPAVPTRKRTPPMQTMSARRCRASSLRLPFSSGQQVSSGDVLVSIEAMKMETALHADRDGVIKDVHVKAGDQIDAKDLLVVYED